MFYIFFFFNDTATTEIYTLSLHDALPISDENDVVFLSVFLDSHCPGSVAFGMTRSQIDRKSTRLNSSHLGISYAVFCLKKKKKYHHIPYMSTIRRDGTFCCIRESGHSGKI